MKYKRLPQQFFERDTHVVAKQLLGKLLIRVWRGRNIIGRIVEVESYLDEKDLASHAARGRTTRTEVMFGEAGHAYVYLIYGVYNCFNIVTEQTNIAGAILIRALEPVAEISFMQKRRKTNDIKQLTNGPGKLCMALHIDRDLNTEDVVTSKKIFVADDTFVLSSRDIVAVERIGVEYAGADAKHLWRYYIHNSLFVSRK